MWPGRDRRAIEAYLLRAAPDCGADELEHYRQAIEMVRQRGYAVALDAATRQRFGELAAELARHPVGDLRSLEVAARDLLGADYLLVELEGAASYDVTGISAPVFGPDGSVVLVVGLVGFGRGLPAAQIPEVAKQVVATTTAITRDLGRPAGP